MGQNWWYELGHSLGCWLASSLHPCLVWMEERAWELLLHTQSWAGPASAQDSGSKTSNSASQELLGSLWMNFYLPERFAETYPGVGCIQSQHHLPVPGARSLCSPLCREQARSP